MNKIHTQRERTSTWEREYEREKKKKKRKKNLTEFLFSLRMKIGFRKVGKETGIIDAFARAFRDCV